jgi:hypothetical protein
MSFSRTEKWALLKRVDALAAAVDGLLEEGKQHAKVIEGFGEMARVADFRGRLALATARGDANVNELRAKFDELAAQMMKKYGVSPDG